MSFGKLLDDLESALTEARHASGQVEKIVSEIRTRLRALAVALGPISDSGAWAAFATSVEGSGAPAEIHPFNDDGMLKTPERELQPFECPHRDGFVAHSQKGLTRHLHARHFEIVAANPKRPDDKDERCSICGHILRSWRMKSHMAKIHGIRMEGRRRSLKARKPTARLDTPRIAEPKA